MKLASFKYKNCGTDPAPEVLVTTENQYKIRGFNTHYLTKGQVTRIKNEWNKIRKQPWSVTTKERVVMRRVGEPARRSFRIYSTKYIA